MGQRLKIVFLMASGLWLVPTIAYACLPAPFEPEGTKVERFGESRAFLSWDNGIEYLVIDPQLRGNAKDFGLALAFPAKPEVTEAPKELFKELTEHTRPRVRPVPFDAKFPGLSGAEPPGTVSALPVELIETKEVGEFTVSILTATDAQALLDWLNEHGYTVTQQDLENFNYYVAQGGHFFAALKINPQKIRELTYDILPTIDYYDLSPIEFSFPNRERPLLPLRLARDQDPPQEFTLYTLADPPLMVEGAQILYNKEILIPLDRGEPLYVNLPPTSLVRYNPEGKWLTRQEFTIDPSKIVHDLDLTFWSDAYSIHVYEDEVAPAVMPELFQVDAGVIEPVGVPNVQEYVPLFIGEPRILPEERGNVVLGFVLVGSLFIYFALALRALARKYGTRRRWRAWIPFAQWFLLVDIARKPQWWKWYNIFVVLLFIVVIGAIPPFPEPWTSVFATGMVGTFFFQQLLVALCVIAIAKSHGRPFATLYGLFMGFGQPVGAIMFGILAWRKAPTTLPPPQSSWRDLFHFFTRISFKDK